MTSKIKVSVLCLTYNQEDYVKQTLDGFLLQKTNFAFEVLINDDASTDDTQKILKDYATKYPRIIKPVFQKENQYSKGLRNFIPRFLLPRVKGKYLAICEGDDYWTDPDKLQTQVDFMDKHPDYAICFHPVRVVYEDTNDKEFIFPDIKDESWYTHEELFKTNYIPTNSVMYRRQKYRNLPTNIAPADWYLHLYHAQFGKIKYIDKVMSVYRKHTSGMWWNYDKNIDEIWRKHGPAHLAMHHALLKLYGKNKQYRAIIESNIDRLLDAFIAVDKKYGEALVKQILAQFPDQGERLLLAKEDALRHKDKELHTLWEAKHEQDRIIEHKQNQIVLKEKEIAALKNSRIWRLRNLIARLIGKEVI